MRTIRVHGLILDYAMRSDEQWAALMKAEGKEHLISAYLLNFSLALGTLFKFHNVPIARLELLLLGCKTSEMDRSARKRSLDYVIKWPDVSILRQISHMTSPSVTRNFPKFAQEC